MAFIQQPTEAASPIMDDPWNWGVDKVVAILCDPSGPLRRGMDPLSIPEAGFLEKALRESAVNGVTLLTELHHLSLRDELGVKPLGHRTTLVHMIMYLRRKSPRYVHYLQIQNENSYPPSQGAPSNISQSPRHATPLIGSPFQPIPREQSVPGDNLQPSYIFSPSYGQQLASIPSTQTYHSASYQQSPTYESRRVIQGRELAPPARQAPESQAFRESRRLPVEDSVNANKGSQDLIQGKRLDTEDGFHGNKNTNLSLVGKRVRSPDAFKLTSRQVIVADQAIPDSRQTNGDTNRQGEIYFTDENGRKRRRLVLSAIETNRGSEEEHSRSTERLFFSISSGEEKSTNTDVDNGRGTHVALDLFEGVNESTPLTVHEQVEPIEGTLNASTTIEKTPEAGTVVIDSQGRKRMRPILVSQGEHAQAETASQTLLVDKPENMSAQILTQSPTFQILELSPRQRKNIRKPYQMYLGVQSLPVDQLFYGNTKFGDEVDIDDNWQAEDPGNFVIHGCHYGNGQRCYVNTRMRHFLSPKRTRTVEREGQQMLILVPYPDIYCKKNRQLSVTVFQKSMERIIALRMERSTWLAPAVPNKGEQVFMENDTAMANIASIQSVGEDMDWDFLEKWKYQDGGAQVLPVYGESGSEGQYDLDTWREMEEERGRIPRPLGQSKNKRIDGKETQQAIEKAVEQMTERWVLFQKPKLQLKAWLIWKNYKRQRIVPDSIESWTHKVQHLEARLCSIRNEILREEWSSVVQVLKQCKSMERSIFDQETYKWKISLVKLQIAPERPPLTPRKQKSAKPKALQVLLEDGGEDVVSNISESGGSDDDLDSFIDDNDIDETSFISGEEDLNRPILDSEPERFSSMQISDPDNAMVENEDIKLEELQAEGIKAALESQLSARSKKDARFYSKIKPAKDIEIIDLTQHSESSEAENDPPFPGSPVPTQTPPFYPANEESPIEDKRMKRALFKRPPMTSSIIEISSDSAEYSTVKEDVSTSPQSSLPEFGEVKKIAELSVDLLVERRDRKRLLIWLIARTSPETRDRVISTISTTTMPVSKTKVWLGLKAMSKDTTVIPGITEDDSAPWMVLAAWYIAWTIPVKSEYEQGILIDHLKTTRKDHIGFLPFYQFLLKCMLYYNSDEHTRAATRNSKAYKSKKPKRQELREASDDTLERTPHKKRKYAVPESQETITLRQNAQQRVRDRDSRQKTLKRRLKEVGFNDDDSSMVMVNPGKLDDQAFIYINPLIGRRMQPHQKEGVQFMWREIITDHQGCLLAQTMGLGKTMQVITLLVTIAEAARSLDENIRNQVPLDLHQSRTLILCPPALIENWWEEFLMWTPSPLNLNIGELRKVTAAIKLEERLYEIEKWSDDGGVLLIGFTTFRDLVNNNAKKTGLKPLSNKQHEMVENALLNRPNIIVADEAHNAKTASSAINKAINRLKSMNRIALTGSPLSNNLDEYYSLIDWIAPNFLGSQVEFKANYSERIQEGLYQDSTTSQYRESLKWLEVLKTELQPKVHRADITVLRGRLKEKQEFVIRVPLTDLQEQTYKIFVETMMVANSANKIGFAKLWAWLNTLRLLCNHPRCFQDKLLKKDHGGEEEGRTKKSNDDNDALAEALAEAPVSEIGISQSMAERQLAPFSGLTEPRDSISLSNKILVLMEIVQFSREIRDKLLIFSHTLDTLNYVEEQMKKAHVRYSRIDGMVQPTDRQQITKEFNSSNVEVCLISTRAGGQGLNLFGANRVVILDDHFNPMWEEQAVGRAYRIGQTKSVFVYYLMVAGTFEETIHNQSVFKQQLARRVVDKKNPARRAVKKAGEFLFIPKTVRQKDLQAFYGKDPLVLDRILDMHKEYVCPNLPERQ